MRPSDLPTDPRLFPLEVCASSELDAAALDEIVAAFKKPRSQIEAVTGLLDDIEAAIRKTGREV